MRFLWNRICILQISSRDNDSGCDLAFSQGLGGSSNESDDFQVMFCHDRRNE